MSIIRVGLAETKGFNDGWDAIFSKKKKEPASTKVKEPEVAKARDKAPAAKKVKEVKEVVAAKAKAPAAVAEEPTRKVKAKAKAAKGKKKTAK